MRREALGIVTVMVLVLGLGLVAGAGGADPDANQVGFWCEEGIKVEPVDTPYVVPEPPEGYVWTLLVIKAGTDNETFPNPVVGDGYSATNGHDNSHVILCKESDETTTTTTEVGSTTTEGTLVVNTTIIDSTTTVVDSSTTTVEDSTTTVIISATSTLPVTGIGDGPGLVALALGLVGLGALAVRSARIGEETYE